MVVSTRTTDIHGKVGGRSDPEIRNGVFLRNIGEWGVGMERLFQRRGVSYLNGKVVVEYLISSNGRVRGIYKSK